MLLILSNRIDQIVQLNDLGNPKKTSSNIYITINTHIKHHDNLPQNRIKNSASSFIAFRAITSKWVMIKVRFWKFKVNVVNKKQLLLTPTWCCLNCNHLSRVNRASKVFLSLSRSILEAVGCALWPTQVHAFLPHKMYKSWI